LANCTLLSTGCDVIDNILQIF